MARGFRVRDPVHNFLNLRKKEVQLIDTGIFQRLRGIRQLALANLVYPGALHTRFDHSLGVCHVAGLLAEQLGLCVKEREHQAVLVRVAGLLHDLGHGPFSHVSEDALERYADRNKLPPEQKKEKIHELITGHLIQHDPDIVRILGQDMCDETRALLKEGHGPCALKAIVSGPLDADKQDYLLRDSRFCGVEYGIFDIHQLHRSLVLYGSEDEEELMIDPDGIHAVEQYVLAKYYLAANVYRHRVRLITDQMIVRAITLGIEHDGVDDLRKLYSFDNSNAFFENYRAWDDARFLSAFAGDAPPGKLSGDMLRRLHQRALLKQVFSSRIMDFADSSLRDLLPDLGKPEHDAARGELEHGIAEVLSKQIGAEVEPHSVIVHAFTIKSVRTTSRDDEGAIMVARRLKPRPFEQESGLFASINEGYTEGYVEVYAAVVWDTHAQRERIRSAVEAPIRELIEALCGERKKGGA